MGFGNVLEAEGAASRKAQRHKSVCCVQLWIVCHLAWSEPWVWKGNEGMLGGSAGCMGV